MQNNRLIVVFIPHSLRQNLMIDFLRASRWLDSIPQKEAKVMVNIAHISSIQGERRRVVYWHPTPTNILFLSFQHPNEGLRVIYKHCTFPTAEYFPPGWLVPRKKKSFLNILFCLFSFCRTGVTMKSSSLKITNRYTNTHTHTHTLLFTCPVAVIQSHFFTFWTACKPQHPVWQRGVADSYQHILSTKKK